MVEVPLTMALGGMGEAPLTTVHMEDVSLTVVPGGKKFRRVAPIVHGGGASATPLEFDVKWDDKKKFRRVPSPAHGGGLLQQSP